jgi:hypothetical protein
VPTYLLARMLLPKRASLAVAFLAVCIPGMAYVTTIVPEVMGYPWYAVCSWLIVRALASRRRLDIFWVAVASVVAILVRAPQFATVPASFLIAAGVLWWVGTGGKRFRTGRSRGEVFGAAVLLVGALVLFNRVFLQHIEIWQVSTQYWKHRMLDLGLKAWLAFTVGMGILPVLGGFASLHLKERTSDPVYRAFAAYLGATIVCVSLYTAVKAAYLSTVFSTLTEERNMIYLSPLMLIGTALVFQSRRLDWRLVTAASAFVVFLVYGKPFQLLFPYFEAPGFAILTIPTRHWSWTVETLRLILMGVLALSVVALVVRLRAGVGAAVVVFLAAWMLSSEIQTTIGFDDFANQIRRSLPTHLDWVDRETHGAPVTYLGQEIQDPNGLLLTEFWNRSVKHVYSLDGSAPGPGPTGTPDIVAPDGRLSRMPDTSWVLTDNGVNLQAHVVHREGQLTLYSGHGPWHLLDGAQQLYSDSWVPDWSSYTYFAPNQHGMLELTLSRQGFNGSAPPGHARILVGTVRLDPSKGLMMGHVYARRRALIENGTEQTVLIPVPKTPVRLELFISPTFRANASDPRNLGAQVAFKFIPATGG